MRTGIFYVPFLGHVLIRFFLCHHFLQALQIPEARWPDYLTRVLAQLPGWTGLIRWRGLNPEDPIQKALPIDVVQYLAVRLFYEKELVELQARREWNIEGDLLTLTKYLQDHGMVDAVVARAEQPEFIGRVLGFLMEQRKAAKAA